MKLSVKARYGLASVIVMAQGGHSGGECVTLASLSERLNISKIYLEQVFSLLKRGGVVTATKGAQGGYHLARRAADITALDVLCSIESSLFEETDQTVANANAALESAMAAHVFAPLDRAVREALSQTTVEALASAAGADEENNFMFYL